jgi:hydroxymethyl cephem carbamoyltransferase
MLIVALNPAHDGAVVAIEDRRLLFSLEAEKDSFPRLSVLQPTTILNIANHVRHPPDVIALSGMEKDHSLGNFLIGAGYAGVDEGRLLSRKFFGQDAKMFSSSHERAHIMMAVGLAPRNDSDRHAVLVWEGGLGHFYLLDEGWKVVARHHVMWEPGNRFAFLFGLADPTFPDSGHEPRIIDAGKLMALAAYGDPADADPRVTETVERICTVRSLFPAGPDCASKEDFCDSPVYNAGVEAEVTKIAAALLTERIFEIFATAAQQHLPPDIPLYISGGCGLNCDWNVKWRELGYFSSVFVPPCANDSGAALGTALDALYAATGDPRIEWSVYSGLEFEWDRKPDPARWEQRNLDETELVDTLTNGEVVAWVQGRWEIGPRALGNRSLLAAPFDARIHDRLNEIKEREGYRPIAPCCRLEDADKVFNDASHDPYMLYFRHVRSNNLAAVTHVDRSARVQTVTRESNERLHDLLSVFADCHGTGVLCNTSLNFKGRGFINRMSDLVKYCETRGISEMVVGDTWFRDTSSDRGQSQAETPAVYPGQA